MDMTKPKRFWLARIAGLVTGSLLMLAAPVMAEPVPLPGSGPIPVVMEMPASLPGFTLYRPAHPRRVRAASLPIIAWGNGGCANLGNSAAELLGEIASHGYIVIAPGPIGVVSRPVAAASAAPVQATPEEQLRQRVANSGPAPTSGSQLLQAIDWAIAANRRGVLAGRLQTRSIAVAGHSCGGLQAISVSDDPRIDTTVMLNSGIFQQPRVPVTKAQLARLHAPIAYFIGGPGDIAYANAEDDFRQISTVPVFKANSTFGHGGKLHDDRGGPTAGWVIKWLDWQLKGDRQAAKAFVGNDCGMCREAGWTLERKGF